MKQLGAVIQNQQDALQKRSRFKIRSERDEMLAKFYEKGVIMVNDRKTKKLRLATMREIALQLGKWKTEDLYILFKECEAAQTFSKLYWWKIKNRITKKV